MTMTTAASARGGFRPVDMNRSFLIALAVTFTPIAFSYTTTLSTLSTPSEALFDNESWIDECDTLVTPASGNNTTAIIVKKDPLFPQDPFTLSQKRHGFVALHIFGVIYTFFALAIVCDEFFVPSLEVIIEKLNITPDVAGATFMAAGGSAPELFTSIMGVFVSFDDVGIGTIVGSAVFNILFVIGACAIFSGSVLSLTWWPLFRDCTFYSVDLIILIVFFRDNIIELHEALILLSMYATYVVFMKWNSTVESFVKKTILRESVTRVSSTDQLMPTHKNAAQTLHGATESCNEKSLGNRRPSNTSTKFRHGLLQLMVHSIDPMHDGKVDEKATQLHAIASLKAVLEATKPSPGATSLSAARKARSSSTSPFDSCEMNGITINLSSSNTGAMIVNDEDDEDGDQPLDLSWPDTIKKKLFYLFTLPIILPLWLTLPDPRKDTSRKFFAVTFVGSILWIAAFSYLMVWWANVVGETLYVPAEVMGLTFLAAGTSVPDLITSVIVARKGCGDMAVSSSVGSNIFDITVGLPFPWIMYNILFGCPVKVNSVGMICSITTLFLMLVVVVISISCFHWKMNHGLGYTMFALYAVFVVCSLLFEYNVLQCPF